MLRGPRADSGARLHHSMRLTYQPNLLAASHVCGAVAGSGEAEKPVRVLITSDDGGGAPGLRALVEEVVAAYPHSVAVASATESGHFGTSLRRDGWLRRPVDLTAAPEAGPMTWQATPALLVKAACEGVWGQPPDVVVVGVNYGPNVGRDVLHSGTVGAALTAINLGVRALALSLDDVF